MRDKLGPAAACVAAATAFLVPGCGSASDSATVEQHTSSSGAPLGGATQQPLSAAEQRGQQLFVDHCGSCHTFHAAGTLGQIGPDLGDIAVNEADVLQAIRTGGGRHAKGQGVGPSGNMPPNLVIGKDAHEVAAFVAANASGSSTP
jgi:mono/diheme cytochrome c family protein